jgi:hypothetical protein
MEEGINTFVRGPKPDEKEEGTNIFVRGPKSKEE